MAGCRKSAGEMTLTRKHHNVVAAVIEVDGQVLCMQRGTTRYPYTSHLWEFPGGKIEPGDENS